MNVTFGTNEPKVSPHTLPHCSMIFSPSYTTGNTWRGQISFTGSEYILRCAIVLQYLLYILMVFDDWDNGIIVAFIAIEKSKEKDI